MNDSHPLRQFDLMTTRRQLFGRAALGLGTAAMAQLLGPEMLAADSKPNTKGKSGLHRWWDRMKARASMAKTEPQMG